MRWTDHLPEEYLHRVDIPLHFEIHEEGSAGARKVRGFDMNGKRCFYFHEYVLTEERFDEEETALFEMLVYHELIFAWKLNGDGWLKFKAFSVHTGDCCRRRTIRPFEIVEERELER